MVRHGFGSGLGFLGSREVRREKNIPLKERDLNVLKERGLCKNINGIQTLTDKQFFKVQLTTMFCEKIITGSVHSINTNEVLTPAGF